MLLFRHGWYRFASRDGMNLSGGFVFEFTAVFPTFHRLTISLGGFTLAAAGRSPLAGGASRRVGRLAAAWQAGWSAQEFEAAEGDRGRLEAPVVRFRSRIYGPERAGRSCLTLPVRASDEPRRSLTYGVAGDHCSLRVAV